MQTCWPKEMILQGAGMPEVDGTYTRHQEDYCGVPQWKHVDREMWIFWGGDFEGYWVIGHSHFSGDGYRYTQAPSFADEVWDQPKNTSEKLPMPPNEEDWGVYITGYNVGEGFVGGVDPAPNVVMTY